MLRSFLAREDGEEIGNSVEKASSCSFFRNGCSHHRRAAGESGQQSLPAPRRSYPLLWLLPLRGDAQPNSFPDFYLITDELLAYYRDRKPKPASLLHAGLNLVLPPNVYYASFSGACAASTACSA